MAIAYSTAVRNAKMDAITAQAGGSALLRLYSGTRAASPATVIGAQVLLATLTCNATFAPAASGGVLTLNAIANGTGTAGAGAGTAATWFRLLKSDGTTVICDGNVGISGSDLNLNNTSIATGQTVSLSAFALTEGNP